MVLTGSGDRFYSLEIHMSGPALAGCEVMVFYLEGADRKW